MNGISGETNLLTFNLYGLPEFFSYSILLGISFALIGKKQEISLRFWRSGWLIILVHSAFFLLFSGSTVYDVLTAGSLILASQFFILAAYYQGQKTAPFSQIKWPVILSGISNVIFSSLATVAGLAPNQSISQFTYLFAVIAAFSSMWLAMTDKAGDKQWHHKLSIGLVLAAQIILYVTIQSFGFDMASIWQLCWSYLAVAYFFIRQAPRLSMGVMFVALSFVLWGLVFPVAELMSIYAQAAFSNVESGVWNLPKFLAAASMILVLLENRMDLIIHLATHDELTGLPNRRLFNDRFDQVVSRAKRNHTGFALIVIDLNDFKHANDTYGHQVGDALLKEVSNRFSQVLRDTDTIARTGGDEFTVIIEQASDRQHVDIVKEKLIKSLQDTMVFDHTPYHASASFGSAIFPEDGLTQTQLLTIADRRMYEDKPKTQHISVIYA